MKEFLLTEYSSILNEYLEKGDEASLQRGYDFGRKAIESKIGILRVSELHQQALYNYLKTLSTDLPQTVLRSSEILAASLAPFQMTHLGYEEVIGKLRQVNIELNSKADELANLNKEMDAFNYSVSHDLRAPLRSIMGFIHILTEEASASLNPTARDALQRIITAAQNMNALIDGLLSMSRLTRREVIKQKVNLSQMVMEIIDQLKGAYPNRKSEIKIRPDIWAKADPILIHAVLTNLLSNAWKFTVKAKIAKIEFGVTTIDNKAVYFVKDNGVGFDMQYAEKLFGEFQRMHNKEEFEGTGIGLATVKRIIHRHGGKIWAEAHVNRGANFYFTLD